MVLVYPLKLDEKIIPMTELKSKEEHTNKAVVLKQLIYHGLEDYIISLCAKGRLSVGKAAEILDLSIYDIHRIAKEKGIKLTASEDQRQKSEETTKKLIKKLKRM